ncbi:MAG TPA: helix-turn-helix transcriptional regulator [Ktedonobacteraceae bacterium]
MLPQQRRAEQVRREMIGLCHAGLDSRTLRIELLRRLRSVLPFDSSCFITADPATLLFTGSVVDELTSATPLFIENEFLHDDINKFAWLVRSHPTVADLARATQGELERSRRYREILAPNGIGDELRAALLTGACCWGFLCLHRGRSRPPFSLDETAYLARLTPHFAQGLRIALLLSSTTNPRVPDEPGLLLLAEDLSVVAITPAAERWLAEVGEADWPRKQALPYAISAVVARMLALEQGKETQPSLSARARLRTASGHWLVLHASRLAGRSTQGQIAVIVEVARPVEVAPLIVQAYDLSKREGEIMQSVLHGHSTTEMAATFHISSNTVQDHLKAIFEKVGVRSRRELVGQLFAQHYQPHIASGRGLDTNGWFT